MPLRATIGLTNYTGTACTFNFEKSVCILPETIDKDHYKVRQLLALFPGSVVEEVDEAVVEEAPEKKSTVGKNDAEVKADLEAAVVVDEAAKTEGEGEEQPEEEPAPEAETVDASAETGDLPAVTEEAVVEEDEDEPEESAAPIESTEDKIGRLVEENTRDELVEMANETGATFSSRATKIDIAREIVEAEEND